VQLSYAIGVAEPLSVFVDSYSTGKKSDEELVDIVLQNFDLRPGVIVQALDLQKPQYRRTAAYGHFGKLSRPVALKSSQLTSFIGNPAYSWEKPKQLKL
jgi:S-adenosylmethionine synthetase